MYTKGEWFISQHHGGTFIVTEAPSGIRTTIATIEEAYPQGKGQQANAQLVAAAPDLYEACKRALFITHNKGFGLNPADGKNLVTYKPEDINKIGNACREALAKADGGK